MKLSTSLLQAITLGVSVTAVAAATTSCEKQKIEQKKERTTDTQAGGCEDTPNSPQCCPACGMG